jgi:hypothetical protein
VSGPAYPGTRGGREGPVVRGGERRGCGIKARRNRLAVTDLEILRAVRRVTVLLDSGPVRTDSISVIALSCHRAGPGHVATPWPAARELVFVGRRVRRSSGRVKQFA